MEAKKNARITIKSLSEVFEKEMTCMKDKVNDLEEKLLGSEAKIKNLEEKLSQNVKVYEKNEENDTN